MFARWDDIVGANIAAHVRPLRLDEGVLVVEVTDPAWATQVRLLSDRLRGRLSEVVGVDVHTVDVRVNAPGSRRR